MRKTWSARGGFDLRLRLPAAEVSALAAAGAVTIELTEPSVQRRFPGELIRWHALHQERYALLAVLPLYGLYQALLLNSALIIGCLDEIHGSRMRW